MAKRIYSEKSQRYSIGTFDLDLAYLLIIFGLMFFDSNLIYVMNPIKKCVNYVERNVIKEMGVINGCLKLRVFF